MNDSVVSFIDYIKPLCITTNSFYGYFCMVLSVVSLNKSKKLIITRIFDNISVSRT